MSKIFDTFDVDYNSVSFRYTASGVKEHVFVDKPDGVGVTQWLGFWHGVKEFYDMDKTFAGLIDDIKFETSKKFDHMEDDNYDLRSEVRKLEKDNELLVEENDRLEARIAELEK